MDAIHEFIHTNVSAIIFAAAVSMLVILTGTYGNLYADAYRSGEKKESVFELPEAPVADCIEVSRAQAKLDALSIEGDIKIVVDGVVLNDERKIPEDVPVLEYAKEKDTSILNHYFTMGAYEKTVTVTDGSVTAVNFEGR